jgi:regulator of sigma E protease
MINFLWAVIAFILAIAVLVSFHEYGHLWVARRLGIKILRFSIGFGKSIWSRTSKKTGTEYCIAMIPLGGYVKMLDESEGNVAEHDLPYAYNRKPVWVRMLVVLAGPAFNFIFAIFAYWLVFSIGATVVAPVVGATQSQSIAAQAGIGYGDELISVNENAVRDWYQVNLALISKLGEKGKVNITYKPLNSNTLKKTQLDLENWKVDSGQPDILRSLGFSPFYPKISTEIFQVSVGGAAARAGIKPNDKIMSIAGTIVSEWSEMTPILDKHINQLIPIEVLRDGKIIKLNITPIGVKQADGFLKGQIGIRSAPVKWSEKYLRHISYPMPEALWQAAMKTWHMISLTFHMLYKMVIGQISMKSISGPVGIAQGAGYSAQLGFNFYLSFLALISISLGVINLLPIPMLDGGHFLYYLIEIVRGKPLTQRAQVLGFKLGLIFVVMLMAVAITNDISRLF